MWIDTSDCADTFHEINKVNGKWLVTHGDGDECDEVEFGGELTDSDDAAEANHPR